MWLSIIFELKIADRTRSVISKIYQQKCFENLKKKLRKKFTRLNILEEKRSGTYLTTLRDDLKMRILNENK